MKNIGLITMGGTISAKGNDRCDLKDYQSGILSGEDFLDYLPEINQLANIKIFSNDRISSTQINEKHWIQLKKQIDCLTNEEGYDGIVITHGTNTIEETAYFLHLTVNTNKPIVLVGAQRPFTALSTDTHINLLNAVRVAVDSSSIGKGVVVAINNEIHSAREVTKTDTYSLDTFQSGKIGPLGFIDADNSVQYYRVSTRVHTKKSEFIDLNFNNLSRIEIVYSYAGTTGSLIDFITDSKKYSGIVMAGTGAGRFSKYEEEALHRARKNNLMIVRSSRVGHGRVVTISPYKDLDSVSSDNLTPQKARILLMLALVKYKNTKDIQRIYNEY